MFRRYVFQKKILQPIFFSLSDCVDNNMYFWQILQDGKLAEDLLDSPENMDLDAAEKDLIRNYIWEAKCQDIKG